MALYFVIPLCTLDSHPLEATFVQREVSTQLTEGLSYSVIPRKALGCPWESRPLEQPSLCKGRGTAIAVEGAFDTFPFPLASLQLPH